MRFSGNSDNAVKGRVILNKTLGESRRSSTSEER
jgi:hypothetical protein